MLTTDLCRTLGVELPIWNAGMGGGLAGPALAAAVSNAGGLGVLGMGGLPEPVVREQLREARTLTDRPLGANLILPLLPDDAPVECCLEEGVSVLVLFWGDPGPYVERAHAAGSWLVAHVGSADEARAAADAGVDAVMIQGVEAGGHVRGVEGLATVLPATVDAVAPLPVVASGGIGDGRGVAAALALGAQAVSLGTRFLCSDESRAAYKDRVVAATGADTIHTKLFDVEWPDAAHRVLRNRIVEEWLEAGSPASGQRAGEGEVTGKMPVGGQTVDLPRYSIFMPMDGFEGDLDASVLYAGESCSLVSDVRPAAEIVRTLAADADAARSG
ncbi:nitronate monooxygenase [Actinomycetospora lutea]|uniref:NAD(P)H-dependent flavin oxidoreductase n=1 Tax=Actinomycetospora lutea TaxID=663604 RepID=UPI002366EC09|nr:nitronate monooxygenase [Actinomycetospora lutea]MDD7941572.1 nitronate monooxygenase [Actinomycetospora lutea]